MISEWKWTKNDRLLHFLPLHHVHGIVNLLLTPLHVGATIDFIKFDPQQVWKQLKTNKELTLFMGVPNIYFQLIQAFDKGLDFQVTDLSNIRLFVCGSAALPATLFKRWEQISGQKILERYGMTEFGMGLTNPYEGGERHAGYVGHPFPSVQVRIIGEDGETEVEEGESGILHIRGTPVFQEYFNRPEQTKAEFDKDGWFITGDVARFDKEKKAYQILGRNSVDIIKSNAYKISALEIERCFLENPSISEIAVFGVEDERKGERIVAVIKMKDGERNSEEELKEEVKLRLAHYKIPSEYIFVDEIPKNQMGKVNKKQLKQILL